MTFSKAKVATAPPTGGIQAILVTPMAVTWPQPRIHAKIFKIEYMASNQKRVLRDGLKIKF